jgi:hypothetical protein
MPLELIINYTLMIPNSVSTGLAFYAGIESKYLRKAGTYLSEYRSVTS